MVPAMPASGIKQNHWIGFGEGHTHCDSEYAFPAASVTEAAELLKYRALITRYIL